MLLGLSITPEFDKAPELSVNCNLSNRKKSPQEDTASKTYSENLTSQGTCFS